MAIVATTPGSPYQPLLTPRGQPHGILRDFAVGLHLDRLQGDPLLAIGVMATVVATAAFLLLLREAFRGTVSVRAVAVVVVGAHVLLLLVPLLFSRDVYSYAFYGRIAGVYGGNPYVQTPLDHSSDVLWNFVGPRWVDTPAYYGPLWVSFSALLSKVLPRPIDHVDAYRFVAIAAGLSTCGVIVWVVRRLRPERTAFALAVFGANPVVLFYAVASGHNDLLVALAIVSAFALLVAERESAAVAILTLAVLIKVTALLPLILLLVWCVARRPRGQRRVALLSRVGLSAAIGVLFASPYLQLRDPTLGMFGLAGQTGWLAPPTVVAHAIDVITFHTLGWTVRLGALVLLARGMWTLESLRPPCRRSPASRTIRSAYPIPPATPQARAATHQRSRSAPRRSSASATSVRSADPNAGARASAPAASRELLPNAHQAHPAPISRNSRKVRRVARAIVEGSDGESSPAPARRDPWKGTFVARMPFQLVSSGAVNAAGSPSSSRTTTIPTRAPGSCASESADARS